MKKIACFVLTFALIFSISNFAFADNEEDDFLSEYPSLDAAFPKDENGYRIIYVRDVSGGGYSSFLDQVVTVSEGLDTVGSYMFDIGTTSAANKYPLGNGSSASLYYIYNRSAFKYKTSSGSSRFYSGSKVVWVSGMYYSAEYHVFSKNYSSSGYTTQASNNLGPVPTWSGCVSISPSHSFGGLKLDSTKFRFVNVTGKIAVKINYLDEKGNSVSPYYLQWFDKNEEYDIPSPVVSGAAPNMSSVSGVADKDKTIDVVYGEAPTTRNLTVNYLYTDNTPAAESVTYPFEPGAEFSIPSPEIPGYRPNRSVISGIMPDEDASIDVFYSQLFYPLTIKYQYADGTQAAEDAVANYPMGFEYGVPSPEISGYTPNQAMVSGIMPAQAVTETVTYVGKPYTLTIIYQYENGLQATDTYQGWFITGSHYSIPSPKIEGYAPSEDPVTGTMPGNDVTRTVIYKVDSGGSSGAGGTGPGGGGESGGGNESGGGETGGGEFTGNDPFILPEIPPFSGKNPFLLPDFSPSGGGSSAPDVPPFSGRDPFRIYGLPPYSYDPFMMPDSLKK